MCGGRRRLWYSFTGLVASFFLRCCGSVVQPSAGIDGMRRSIGSSATKEGKNKVLQLPQLQLPLLVVDGIDGIPLGAPGELSRVSRQRQSVHYQ